MKSGHFRTGATVNKRRTNPAGFSKHARRRLVNRRTTSRYKIFIKHFPPSAGTFETCQLIRLGVFVGLRYTSAATRLVQFGETPDGNLGEEREPFRNVRIASHDRGG